LSVTTTSVFYFIFGYNEGTSTTTEDG